MTKSGVAVLLLALFGLAGSLCYCEPMKSAWQSIHFVIASKKKRQRVFAWQSHSLFFVNHHKIKIAFEFFEFVDCRTDKYPLAMTTHCHTERKRSIHDFINYEFCTLTPCKFSQQAFMMNLHYEFSQ